MSIDVKKLCASLSVVDPLTDEVDNITQTIGSIASTLTTAFPMLSSLSGLISNASSITNTLRAEKYSLVAVMHGDGPKGSLLRNHATIAQWASDSRQPWVKDFGAETIRQVSEPSPLTIAHESMVFDLPMFGSNTIGPIDDIMNGLMTATVLNPIHLNTDPEPTLMDLRRHFDGYLIDTMKEGVYYYNKTLYVVVGAVVPRREELTPGHDCTPVKASLVFQIKDHRVTYPAFHLYHPFENLSVPAPTSYLSKAVVEKMVKRIGELLADAQTYTIQPKGDSEHNTGIIESVMALLENISKESSVLTDTFYYALYVSKSGKVSRELTRNGWYHNNDDVISSDSPRLVYITEPSVHHRFSIPVGNPELDLYIEIYPDKTNASFCFEEKTEDGTKQVVPEEYGYNKYCDLINEASRCIGAVFDHIKEFKKEN